MVTDSEKTFCVERAQTWIFWIATRRVPKGTWELGVSRKRLLNDFPFPSSVFRPSKTQFSHNSQHYDTFPLHYTDPSLFKSEGEREREHPCIGLLLVPVQSAS